MLKLKTAEDYIRKGKEIFHKHCSSINRPFMFPPAPNQQRVDFYKAKDVSLNLKLAENEKLQQDYEAEVKVYRSIEKLSQPIIALHGFKFSHYQFRIWESFHCPKVCSNSGGKCTKRSLFSDDGEQDFLAIGSDYIVIIEVKNSSSEGFSRALQKSHDQQHRFSKLLSGVCRKSQSYYSEVAQESKRCRFFKVSVFPHELKQSRLLPQNENSLRVFSKDLEDFESWWRQNILTSDDCSLFEDVNLEIVQNVLIAIWASDNRGYFEESLLSLSYC